MQKVPMHTPYRSLLLLLLPAVGCTGSVALDDTGDTQDTSVAPTSERGCYAIPADEKVCPARGEVPVSDVIPETCGATVLSVDAEGELGSCGWIGGITKSAWCIYPITVIPPKSPCDYGRPLILGGAPRVAPLVRGDGWATGERARTAEGSVDVRRAATWAMIGLAEHASVASFSRFALELLAVGAPADLVMDAHAAAQDEIRHAQLAFGLASRAGGVPVAPGPLALGALAIRGDLVALAVATVREGCVAETLSALQVARARDLVTDPAERAALTVLARDEARHAALAWRFVRWAVTTGGAPVREAVAAALTEAPSTTAPSTSDAVGGLLAPEVASEVIARGWAEVVVPAGEALLRGADEMATA